MDTHEFFRNLLLFLILPTALVVVVLGWIAWRRDDRAFLQHERQEFERNKPDLPAEPLDNDPETR